MIVQIIWTSIAASTYSILFAVAFALVLKVTKIWNFAQPALMTIAFYSMYWAASRLSLSLPLAFCAGLIPTVLAGWALERYAFDTLRRRNTGGFTFFIFTLIFSEFVSYLFTLLFGTEPFTILPNVVSPVVLWGGIVVSYWDLRSLAASAVLLAGVYLLLRRSKAGRELIAVSTNERLAELYGISSRQSYRLSLILAAVLCAAGMAILGTRIAVHPHLGFSLILFSVAATVLGGIGNVLGAALAAFFLSLLQGLSGLILPSRWQNLLFFLFLFLIIILMPRGFGSFAGFARGRKA